jgi:hypothetical protein
VDRRAAAGEDMRKRTSAIDSDGVPCVLVPSWLLTRMGEITSETLRVVLFFRFAEFRAGKPGVSLPPGELAEGSGLSQGRTRVALVALGNQDVVEAGEPGMWRLKSGPPRSLDAE